LQEKHADSPAEQEAEGINGDMKKAFVIEEVEVGDLAFEPSARLIKEKIRIEIDVVGVRRKIKGRGGSRKEKTSAKTEEQSFEIKWRFLLDFIESFFPFIRHASIVTPPHRLLHVFPLFASLRREMCDINKVRRKCDERTTFAFARAFVRRHG
jgi:hypothetical protein